MDNEDTDRIKSKQAPITFTLISKPKEQYQLKDDLKFLNDLEVKEVTEVMQNYFDFHSNLKESQGVSMKNFDWLSSLFVDTDIKNNFTQRETIKKILINQSLYYLILFYTLYLKRQKELYSTSLPILSEKTSIGHIQTLRSQSLNPPIKIGIIGCGNIGSTLLRKLIIIKDKNLLSFKLYVSTRRPEIVKQDFIHCLDDSIEINLNNEQVFTECDIIYLCIQPHQLDFLAKDVKNCIEERIDKLNKKKTKFYPLIVSFLCATPIERLRLFFNENIAIVRTYLDHRQMYLKRIEVPIADDNTLNQGNTIEKINNLWESKRTYIKESGEHLIQKGNIEVIEKIIGMLVRQFYTTLDKEKSKEGGMHIKNNNININTNLSNSFEKRKNVFPSDNVPELIMRTLMNKAASEKYKSEYDIISMKFKPNAEITNIIQELSTKYNKHLSRFINFDE